MQIELQPQNPQPLYQQLVEQLRRQIVLGVLAPGSRLPTVRELAVLARVNRNTAGRAIQALEAAGLVHSRVGRGTFVADDAPARGSEAVDLAIDELLDRTIAEARDLGAPLESLPDRLRRRIREESP